jgi:hypothetical protein
MFPIGALYNPFQNMGKPAEKAKKSGEQNGIDIHANAKIVWLAGECVRSLIPLNDL